MPWAFERSCDQRRKKACPLETRFFPIRVVLYSEAMFKHCELQCSAEMILPYTHCELMTKNWASFDSNDNISLLFNNSSICLTEGGGGGGRVWARNECWNFKRESEKEFGLLVLWFRFQINKNFLLLFPLFFLLALDRKTFFLSSLNIWHRFAASLMNITRFYYLLMILLICFGGIFIGL